MLKPISSAPLFASLGMLALLAGCGGADLDDTGDFRAEYGIPGVLNPSAGARIEFSDSAFHGLSSPNRNSCAGDVKQYYLALDSNASQLPLAYPFGSDEASVRPPFLKNVAVDLTDASSRISGNQASSCSITSSTITASACASFDAFSVNGMNSTLGGSFLMIGSQGSADAVNGRVACGVFSSAPGSTGTLSCPGDFFALSIERSPSDYGAQSSWSKISKSSAYAGPGSAVGASIAIEPRSRKVVYFGGYGTKNYSDLDVAGGEALVNGTDLNETWVYDLGKQSWSLSAVNFLQDSSITNIPQAELDEAYQTSPFYSVPLLTGGNSQSASRTLPPRANFGAISSSRFAVKDFQGTIDDTDRVLIFGGLTGVDSSMNFITNQQIYRFNPTYGPDYADHDQGASGTAFIQQFLDVSPLQVLSNNQKNLQLWADGGYPYGTPAPTPAPDMSFRPMLGSGYVDLVQSGGANYGFLMALGGNDARFASINLSDATYAANDYNNRHGVFRAQPFNDPFSGSDSNQDRAGLGNYSKSDRLPGTSAALGLGSGRSPYRWVGSDPAHVVPKLFGMQAVKGFDLSQNDVVVFGGINCRDYLSIGLDSSCSDGVASSVNASTQYFRLGALTAGAQASQTAPSLPAATSVNPAPNPMALPTNVPSLAGMATARGLDNNEQPIVVAWGGTHSDLRQLSGVASTAHRDAIYLLVNVGCPNPPNCTTLGTPTWLKLFPSSTARPPIMSNAAMVFSHVTQKFYLFGGYDRTNTTAVPRNDTWELTISGCDLGFDAPGAGNLYGCAADWRQMNVETNGLTCAPDCTAPTGRRGHQFYEVNFYNKSPTSEYRRADCTVASPCSFGIFMEGGVSDAGFLTDRWVFDPTAHAGQGHWQRVDDLPARRLAAMGGTSYEVYPTKEAISRVFLFGGEYGLQNPEAFADPALYRYLPPILGDTLAYDTGAKRWERVELFGKGLASSGAVSYSANTGAPSAADDSLRDEFDRRQSYAVDPGGGFAQSNAVLSKLAPEPRAGAQFIARNSRINAAGDTEPLAIPELYLVGGRLKSGAFAPLSQIWKLCAGSPRDRFYAPTALDDGVCESYDASLDPQSRAPVRKASARWLLKQPTALANYGGLYQSSGAYHSGIDRLVFAGGKTDPSSATQAYTGTLLAAGTVLEYAFPKKSITPITTNAQLGAAPEDYFGEWFEAPACSGSAVPAARYGHSLAYDPLKDEVILVGGYDATGAPLMQTYVSNGGASAYLVPQVWAGKRKTSPSLCYEWRPITAYSNVITSTYDPPLGRAMGHAASVFVPPNGYATGYYSLFDRACEKQGTIQDADPIVNKLYAGGVYIDLDRGQLGKNENLLVNLTFVAGSLEGRSPDGARMEDRDQTVFRMHLIQAAEDVDVSRATNQPRHLAYTNASQYPKMLDSFSILTPEEGGLREEQIVIPISAFQGADRIRIERESGSAVIVRAKVFRIGRK